MKEESILASRIYESRKLLGVTQETLAEKLGITPQSISRWENGQSRPDVDMLPKLAALFGITIDALFGYHAENLKILQYEEEYKNAEHVYNVKVRRMAREILALLPPNNPTTVLEIGCEDGQNASFFARNGYIVSAFDKFADTVAKAEEFAKKIGVNVNFFCADLATYKIESNFDIIYSSFAMNQIPLAARKIIFENIQAHTNVGGLNAFTTFVEKSFVDNAGGYQSAEIFGYYRRNWKFEVMEEIYCECENGNACVDIMIARKIAD